MRPADAHSSTADRDTLDRVRTVFADTCARCHSSKLPKQAFRFFPEQGCSERVPRLLERLLDVDKDRRIQARHAQIAFA
jgi:hypothetical protein